MQPIKNRKLEPTARPASVNHEGSPPQDSREPDSATVSDKSTGVTGLEAFGRVRATQSLSLSTRIEMECLETLDRLLKGEKRTFVFDIDGTAVNLKKPSNKSAQQPDTQDRTSEGYLACFDYLLRNSYPTNPALPFLIKELKSRGHGIGFISGTDIKQLVRLKLAGVDLSDVDFIALLDKPYLWGGGEQKFYDIVTGHLGLERLDTDAIDRADLSCKEKLTDAIKAKYDIRIISFSDAYPSETNSFYNKEFALTKLFNIGEPVIQEILQRPLIAIGDAHGDVNPAYPTKNYNGEYKPNPDSIGIQITENVKDERYDFREGFPNSLGRAICFAVAQKITSSRDDEAQRFLEELRSMGLEGKQDTVEDCAVAGHSKVIGNFYEFPTLTPKEMRAIDKEILEIGPILK